MYICKRQTKEVHRSSLASCFTLHITYCTHGMVEANKVNGSCQQVLADVHNIVL